MKTNIIINKDVRSQQDKAGIRVVCLTKYLKIMEKKFILTDRFIVSDSGKKLFQIQCVKTFKYANAGDLGGYIEKEGNLSQNGNAWIYDNAQVSGSAHVYGSAQVSDDARVFGDTQVSDNAQVFGNACVFGNAMICGNAQVFDYAQVFGNAMICGSAQVSDYAQVFGNANIHGNGSISGDAYVDSNDKHCGFDYFGSVNRHTHAYLTTDGEIEITCGCFRGNLEEFEKQVEETHRGTIYEKQYKAIIEVIKVKFGL